MHTANWMAASAHDQATPLEAHMHACSMPALVDRTQPDALPSALKFMINQPCIIPCDARSIAIVHRCTDGNRGWQGTFLDKDGAQWDVRRPSWLEVISALEQEGCPIELASHPSSFPKANLPLLSGMPRRTCDHR